MQPIPEILTPTSTQPINTITLDVEGMKCAGCVQAVEKQLAQHPGVLSASVNLVTQVATVQCEAEAVVAQDLASRLAQAGFPSQPREQQSPEAATRAVDESTAQEQLIVQIRQVIVAGALVILSGLGHLGQVQGWAIPGLNTIWFHCGLATGALLGPGRSMLVDGWHGLRRAMPNMNTLVSLGTLTAYTASLVALLVPSLNWECFFDEPVMIVGLILLGRTLEQQARGQAASALRALLSLQPGLARWIPQPNLDQNRSIEIPVEQIQVGAWLQVCSGEKFPVDGEIVFGKTTVDESMLTGESLPIFKQPGDPVTGGTLNQSGAVTVKATRTGQDTTLAQIITQVEAAQTRKAPIQRLADITAGYFTYGVIVIAALTFLFWYFLGAQLWPNLALSAPLPHHSGAPFHVVAHPLLLSLKLAIAVLVVACPCALGLATPTAILVGTSLGAERGLLIRGGDVLELVHQLDTVVFDKTGTLTAGQLTVTNCWVESSTHPELTPERLLQIAATVESGVRHPLSKAIQQQAQRQGLPSLGMQNCHYEPGLGVSGDVEGQRVHLGTLDWLTQQGISISAAVQSQADLAGTGKSLVYVAIANEFAGVIAATDSLRPDAAATVRSLQSMGFQVKILTGDRQEAAEAIIQPLNLTSNHIIAGVRPAQKAAMIAQLQAEGRRVAMVGDGSNDAPALAQADVGIALHSGTDVAIETAQIVLMRDWVVAGSSHLTDVVEAIRLSRATFRKIQQNLFWAFAYNLVGIPMAAGFLLPTLGIFLNPAAAGAMMAFSSVSVVTNSLLLRRTCRPVH